MSNTDESADQSDPGPLTLAELKDEVAQLMEEREPPEERTLKRTKALLLAALRYWEAKQKLIIHQLERKTQ